MIPNIPLEELARRYNNGLAVPKWADTLLPRWQRESERVRDESSGVRDAAYGPLARNTLDVFTSKGTPPANEWPALLFIHGGYWQRLSKDDWSVIAAPFVANGMAAVIVGYTLCPQTSIRGIAGEIEAAVSYVWNAAEELNLNRDKLALAGHSAGGHLTAWCMSVDWTTYGLPATPFVSATAVSGLFDLEPMVPIYLNEALKLTNDEALAMSPAYRERRVDCEFTAAVGGAELEEFLRQNQLLGTQWKDVIEWEIPGLNHFTIIDELTRQDSALFKRVASRLRG